MPLPAGSVIQGIFPAGPRVVGVAQRRATGVVTQLPPRVAQTHRGAGLPLPLAVRQPMEAFFRTSFADVRVHVGPHAPAIGAVAYTEGSHIHFAPGQYNPATSHGHEVLGHELAHVVQQRTGRVRNPFGSGVAIVEDRGLEQEAGRLGRAAAAACAQAKLGAVVQSLSARHQQRKQWALNWLNEHGKKSNMKDAFYGHLFKGLPLDGTARDKDDPTGFHAYGDHGTVDLAGAVRTGRENVFHSLSWKYTDSAALTARKASSMFPRNLSINKVIALVLINTVDAWKIAPNPFPPTTATGKAVTSQMLSDTFGIRQAWTLVKTGDTVYGRPT